MKILPFQTVIFERFVGIFITTLAVLLSFPVLSFSDEDVFKYHLKTPINLIDTDWRGELFDQKGQSLGTFLAQDFAGKMFIKQNPRKYLNPIPDQLQLWQSRECRSGEMIAFQVNKHGDVRYFLEEDVFRTGCIPGAYFIELKAKDPLTIEVEVTNFDKEVVATGSLKPEDSSKSMKMLPKNVKDMNQKLTLVTDDYVGYWSGKFDGEWIDLAFKYSDIRLRYRRASSGQVIILSPSNHCVVYAKFGKLIFSPNHNQSREKSGYDPVKNWQEYVNSINIRKLKPLVPEGKGCGKSSLLNKKSVNEYSMRFFLESDGRLKLTAQRPNEGAKVAYFERTAITKYVKQLVASDQSLATFFDPRIMTMYNDPSVSFKSYWLDSYNYRNCGSGPYCQFTAGLYLDAIYRGDFKKAAEIERMGSNKHLKPVADLLLGDYIYFYPEDYASCLQADYSLKIGTEFTNSNSAVKREMVSNYRYNKKFKQACEIVCKFRGLSDVMSTGSFVHDKTRKGLEESMKTLKCDDPAVQQFENNLLKYFNQIHNLR